MASSSSRQNSRFSTLKVFKFGPSAAKPPPPPPKDPYYLPNHSLASLHQPSSSALSPPTTTQPATPTSASPYSSAGYAASARSPSPTSSYHMPSYAPSFAASRTTLAPSSGSIISPEPTSEGSSSRKGFFKFSSLGKRPKTPRSASSTSTNSSEPLSDTVEDPGISRPWNFQHNVHVDEAFVGLPPTWSASLAEMGFSEEEIDNIHARRAASKPTLYALRPERPDSPASSMYSARSRTAPPLQPPPRRDFDNMSRNSEFSYASRNLSSSTDADPSVAEDSASVYTMSRRLAQSPETTYASASQFPYPPSSLPSIQSSAPPSKDSRPRTPPKRVYHVVNDSVSTISPPPAYTSSQRDSFLTPFVEQSESGADGLDTASLSAFGDRRSEAVIGAEAEDEVGELNGDSSPSSSDRTSKLPPRLSLHQDTFSDLSSWTESLFSIIPEAPVKQAGAAETSSRAAEGSSSTTVTPSKKSASSRMSSVSARHRTLPPQKPLPAHVLPGGHTTPGCSTSPPPPLPLSSSKSSTDGDLWDEVYGMVRTPEQDSHPSPKPPPSPTHEAPDVLSIPQAESRPSSSELKVEFTRDNRDSNLSTMTVTPATIVRHVSVVKRTRANIIKSPPPRSDSLSSMALSTDGEEVDDKASARSGRSTSPMSSDSNDSDASSMGVSITSGSEPVSSSSSRPTTLSAGDMGKWKGSDIKSATIPYVETSPQPSPLAAEFSRDNIITQATVRNFRESEEASGIMQRPSILIDNMPVPDNGNAGSPWSAMTPSPATPALRYAGWVTEVVSPIKEFIDDTVDPRDLYADLQEVAEGESGSVFAARVVRSSNAQDYVAIKQVALLPSGSQKLVDLERELRLVKHLRHPNVLSMDMLYVDLVEDSLWISMELMDRSLADVLNLVEEGVRVEEKYISCFAKDTLTALSFLQAHGISHRDVRSDNLLVNHNGVVKLADFSNAVKVLPHQPLCDEPAGVIYWQAPEMRSGPYDPLKVDVWSLGATVWELAQAEPPFADVTDPSQIGDTLPPLDSPESFSRSFHEFLQLCSQPRSSRPDPEDLLDTPFVRNAHDRSVVAELLLRCRSTEEDLAKRLSVVSQGTVCP